LPELQRSNYIPDEMMEVTVTRGRRCKQLLDGLKKGRRDWNWRRQH